MRRTGIWAVVLAGGMFASAVAASAHPSSMIIGGTTSQPIGHKQFCDRFPSECSIRPRSLTPQSYSRTLMDDLKAVTVSVNAAVKPMSDMDQFGVEEFWTYPEGAGDCEEYALQKQKVLSAKGLSRANLLITVLRKPDGEGHAVLTVRTDGGDFILDNLTDEVKPWDETGYFFRKRQASEYSGRWVTIEDGHNDPVVSAIE